MNFISNNLYTFILIKIFINENNNYYNSNFIENIYIYILYKMNLFSIY